MIKEITHIAVIQTYGIVVDDSVASKPFHNFDDAHDWLFDQIAEAHGDTVDVGHTGEVTVLTTPGGPTKGWILPA